MMPLIIDGVLYPNFLQNTIQGSSSGPLGNNMTWVGGGDQFPQPTSTMGFMYFGGGNAEIDTIYKLSEAGTGFIFAMDTAFFYSCQSATCAQDFTPNDQPCLNLGCGANPVNLVNFSVAQVPEAGSRNLILYGSFFLLVFCFLFSHLRTPKTLTMSQHAT